MLNAYGTRFYEYACFRIIEIPIRPSLLEARSGAMSHLQWKHCGWLLCPSARRYWHHVETTGCRSEDYACSFLFWSEIKRGYLQSGETSRNWLWLSTFHTSGNYSLDTSGSFSQQTSGNTSMRRYWPTFCPYVMTCALESQRSLGPVSPVSPTFKPNPINVCMQLQTASQPSIMPTLGLRLTQHTFEFTHCEVRIGLRNLRQSVSVLGHRRSTCHYLFHRVCY